MFDFNILLFILIMWITIMCYFICSHVKHVIYCYRSSVVESAALKKFSNP